MAIVIREMLLEFPESLGVLVNIRRSFLALDHRLSYLYVRVLVVASLLRRTTQGWVIDREHWDSLMENLVTCAMAIVARKTSRSTAIPSRQNEGRVIGRVMETKGGYLGVAVCWSK